MKCFTIVFIFFSSCGNRTMLKQSIVYDWESSAAVRYVFCVLSCSPLHSHFVTYYAVFTFFLSLHGDPLQCTTMHKDKTDEGYVSSLSPKKQPK